MMCKVFGWLGLNAEKPQGPSLGNWGVASGSAASHPDPGNSYMVEFSEESRNDLPRNRPSKGSAECHAEDPVT